MIRKALLVLSILGLVACASARPATQTPSGVATETTPATSISAPTASPSTTNVPTFSSTFTITPTFDPKHIQTYTPVPPAVCPKAILQSAKAPSIEIPDDPNKQSEYIINYLSIYGPQGLIEYFSHNYQPDHQIRYDDVTNDGVADLIITLFPSYFFIFGCQNEGYVLLYSFAIGGIGIGEIEDVVDANRDGIPEILLNDGNYSDGGHSFRLIEWNGSSFIDIPIVDDSSTDTSAVWVFPYGKVYLRDVNGDGLEEMVVENGVPVGGGIGDYFYVNDIPFRDETDYYRWNGSSYFEYKQEFDPPIYRFQAVQDGDRDSLNGNFAHALDSYMRAISDPTLGWWSPDRRTYLQFQWDPYAFNSSAVFTPPIVEKNEYPNLAAYSYYRILLIDLLEGQTSKATRLYDYLQASYPTGHPGYIFATLASAFWTEYQSTRQIGAACFQAAQFASDRHDDVFYYLGNYGNDDFHGSFSLSYTPESICPFK
jgi:hypothetical protein